MAIRPKAVIFQVAFVLKQRYTISNNQTIKGEVVLMSNAEIGVTRNMPAKNSIMTRPRVETILADALRKPVTLVCAGAGCGKSCAVYSYITRIRARAAWIQLSESDNIPSRFWETLCHTVIQLNPELAATLAEIGFPGSGERYNIFYGSVTDALKPNVRYVFVFDDIHLINNPEVLSFLLALAKHPLPDAAHVFISREETISPYEVDMPGNDLRVIDERDLLFTKAEVASYMASLEIEAPLELVDEVYITSEGLAHLVNLAGRIIKKRPDAIQHIRGAIRRNITKLIDDHFFAESTDEMKKFYVKLSLLDHLTDSLVYSLPGGAELMAEAVKKTSLIRYDTYMCAYHLHRMFLEFLQGKESLLTGEEKAETYRLAALWCAGNNYRLEAMGYYEKIGDYAAIISIATPMQLDISFHTGVYLLGILDRADPRIFDENPPARVLYTRMLLALGRIDEAVEKVNGFISELESRDISQTEAVTLIWLYSNLGFAKILKSTYTGEYEFSRFFQKADEYMKNCGIKAASTTINATILPYACVVGSNAKGEPERYIEEIARTIPYTVRTLGGCLYGSDDLTMSEVAYYRGDMAACERYAIQSCLKAREKGQSYIEGRALFLLLRMNLCQGKYPKIKETLAQYDELVKYFDTYIENVQQEVVLSWYYASIGETDAVASWVKSDFLSIKAEAFVTGLEDMAKLKYYLSEKRYHALLAFLNSRPMSHGIRPFVLGRIGMAVSEAVCLYNLKDRAGAMDALKRAYELSAPNAFDMPFIEMGNHMRALVGVALREKNLAIPSGWLEMIRSKSATYAKRVVYVKSCYRRDVGKDGAIQLTLREKEVLRDMSQGLSRTEIAAYRGISVNTVKTMMQIIYEKLGADNNMDAMRAAISMGYI
jgi:LuxR family maltose regulon positive regulatory protein